MNSWTQYTDETWNSLYRKATESSYSWFRFKDAIATIRRMIDQTKDLFGTLDVSAYAFHMELDGRTVWSAVDKDGLTVDLESESPKQYSWSDLPLRVILSVNKPIKYIALGKTHKIIPTTEWNSIQINEDK